jgi:hypothetical protein
MARNTNLTNIREHFSYFLQSNAEIEASTTTTTPKMDLVKRFSARLARATSPPPLPSLHHLPLTFLPNIPLPLPPASLPNLFLTSPSLPSHSSSSSLHTHTPPPQALCFTLFPLFMSPFVGNF